MHGVVVQALNRRAHGESTPAKVEIQTQKGISLIWIQNVYKRKARHPANEAGVPHNFRVQAWLCLGTVYKRQHALLYLRQICSLVVPTMGAGRKA